MIKEPIKKNLSSMQVLKTFELLLQGNYTMNELVEKLNAKEASPVFNNGVVSKYINTCRFCGIKITKIINAYHIVHLPFGMKFTNEESDLLQKLEGISANMSTRSRNSFNRFISKVNLFADKKIIKLDTKNIQFTVESFENAVLFKKQVKIICKNRDEIIGKPITTTKQGEKTYFQIFSNNKMKIVDSSRVSGIQVLNNDAPDYMPEHSIVFTLRDKLAKRYELRENERILNQDLNGGTITVSNLCSDDESLILRLMRYDDKCKVETPSAREQIKTQINEALKNYGIE